MMLTPSWFKWPRMEYSVVVLPEPVGPVTSMMPSGRDSISCIVLSWSSDKPRPSSGTMPRLRSKIRSTKFSPWMVGCTAERKSTARPEMVSEMRPSCGARVSAMFMPAMTFSRTTIADQ